MLSFSPVGFLIFANLVFDGCKVSRLPRVSVIQQEICPQFNEAKRRKTEKLTGK
jgi:hypothetical protein